MSHLDNVLLKLNRASERAAALAANVAAFCRDHPITLDAQLREGRLGINLVCQMEGVVVPLKEWSLELGEIVYSLRSALDNLIICLCANPCRPAAPPVGFEVSNISRPRSVRLSRAKYRAAVAGRHC